MGLFSLQRPDSISHRFLIVSDNNAVLELFIQSNRSLFLTLVNITSTYFPHGTKHLNHENRNVRQDEVCPIEIAVDFTDNLASE